MGEDGDDDIDWELVGKVATTDGSLNWPRIKRGIRGSEARDDWDLSVPIGLSVLALVSSPVVAPMLPPGIVESATNMAVASGMVLFLFGTIVAQRLQKYYGEDEQIVVEELRAAYAAGELEFEEFRAKIDRLLEDGVEAVGLDDVPGDDAADAEHATDQRPTGATRASESDREAVTTAESDDVGSADGDPVNILQQRFARGEIDAAEYRQRMRMLGEPVPDVGDDGTGAREAETGETQLE
jgi:uncharacterized membrane protein